MDFKRRSGHFKLDGRDLRKNGHERPLESAMTMPVPASCQFKGGEAFRDHYGWCFYQKRTWRCIHDRSASGSTFATSYVCKGLSTVN